MRLEKIVSVLLCFVVVLCLPAQQEPETAATIRKKVDLVLVDVIVTDPKGTIVSGLRARDFEVLDEGTPQELVHLSQDEIPLAIALVVDVSSSMKSYMVPLRDGLIRALPSLKPEDRVALFVSAENWKIEVGLTNDFKKIANRIGGLEAEGLTNVNDAIYEAASYLRKRAPQGRRIIILVSDSGGNTRYVPAKQVERSLIESEVTLFGIRPTFLLLIPSQYNSEIVDVDELSVESGGFIMNIYRQGGFQSAVESLVQILKTRYTLGFYPNIAGMPGSVRHLAVHLRNSGVQDALPKVMLRYRTQYVVPRERPEKSR